MKKRERTVNQHVCSLEWTYVWHPNKQQNVIGAQRGPIQKWWLIFLHQKTQHCRREREREETMKWEDGRVWEKCREDVGERKGGALCLFKVKKKYSTLSHRHNNTTAHIQWGSICRHLTLLVAEAHSVLVLGKQHLWLKSQAPTHHPPIQSATRW